jgi:hypothetical protein
MKTIFKYQLLIVDSQTIEMPKGAQILHADMVTGEFDTIYLWAIVNSDAKSERRRFLVRGTGHPLTENEDGESHIATVLDRTSGFVWHIFESENGSKS